MKIVTLILGLFFSYFASAQDYRDSIITLQMTQRMAYYIGKQIQRDFNWSNRKAPEQLVNYIGSGNNPDSIFTVALKVKYVIGGIELLFNARTINGKDDFRSIIQNQPSIQGYTGLSTQINTLASQGNQSAIFIRDWYVARVADFQALYNQEVRSVVEWSKN